MNKELKDNFKIKPAILEFWRNLSFIKNNSLELEDYLDSSKHDQMTPFLMEGNNDYNGIRVIQREGK